jgi:RND family efflux transporter MFP subunit
MNVRRKMKRALLPTWLALATAAVSCGRNESPGEAGERVSQVEVQLMRLEGVDGIYEASGTIGAEQTATVTSKVPGYVRELRVLAGDRVQAGDTLAVLDDDEIRARLSAAESGLAEAEAAEIEAKNGLKAAEVRAELAQTTYDRFKQLESKRAVTPQEMDEVASRRDAAEADKAAAVARLRRLGASLERARSEVAATEAVWEQTIVRAPYRGRVIERHVDVGSLAMPGSPLLVVEQEGPLVAEVAVDESHAGRIALGDEVMISLDAADESADAVVGKVREVSPAIDPRSRMFTVKVALSPEIDATRYAPGRFVRVSFRVGTAERLLVAETAIVRRGQLELVYVVHDERARLRLVTLGRARNGSVEILSGLDAGDVVVRRASAVSEEGVRVTASP